MRRKKGEEVTWVSCETVLATFCENAAIEAAKLLRFRRSIAWLCAPNSREKQVGRLDMGEDGQVSFTCLPS